MDTVFTLGHFHSSVAAQEVGELAQKLLKGILKSLSVTQCCHGGALLRTWLVSPQDLCQVLKLSEVGG